MKASGTSAPPVSDRRMLKVLIVSFSILVALYVALFELQDPFARWLLIKHADHKEVARACLDVLTHPKRSLPLSEYSNLVTRGEAYAVNYEMNLPPALERLKMRGSIYVSTNVITLFKTRTIGLRLRQDGENPKRYRLTVVTASEVDPEKEVVLCTITNK
jgi:hypothetical protein